MGSRDGMTAEEWESSRNVPDFLKDDQPVAQRPNSTDELLRQIISEQRETNRMLAKIGVLLQNAVKNPPRQQAAQQSPPGPAVDLDSERGNFRVNKDPPKWAGQSFAGCLLSECSPEFLDELTKFYEWRIWKANQTLEKTPDDKKAAQTIKYTPTDIARIKGWATRLRSGYGGGVSQQREPTSDGSVHESDVPTL